LHAYLKGDFYYLYDESNENLTTIRYEYNVNGTVYSNLYMFEHRAMYSMCGNQCTGMKIDLLPDPWWFVDSVYSEVGPGQFEGTTMYQHKPGDVNRQVKTITLVNGATTPVDGFLKRIEVIDGRSLDFSDVVVIAESDHTYDDKFIRPEYCPKPTCPIYADIVFVLDSSGSVDHIEWRRTIEFVVGLMNEFTFGEDAVAAAAVQFCGQDDGLDASCKVKLTDKDCKGKTRFSCDYKLNRVIKDDEIMASVKASDYNGSKPITSTNKDELIRLLNATLRDDCAYPPNAIGNPAKCQAFSGFRGTNQGLGLKLAMKIFDESPRQKYARKPRNIVIAVTDGEDKFPNSTANATKKLEKEYGATVFEVGVALQCDYDRRYLSSIASNFTAQNGTVIPAYFDVGDYERLAAIMDEMFKPLCNTNYSSACSPDCKGFCACGQCLCPTCDESDNVCSFIECNENTISTDVCVEYAASYPIEDDVCTQYVCNDKAPEDPETNKKGKWEDIHEQCQELKDKNPGKCRNIYCEVAYGGCRIDLNDSYCHEKFASRTCEEWECAPVGQAVDDADSGCYMKTNHTHDCEVELEVEPGQPKAYCMTVQCSAGSSVVTKCEDMLVDTCTGNNTACYTYQCLKKDDSSYDCINVKELPKDDNCTTWKCDENEGWVHNIVRDELYCEKQFEGVEDFDMRCKEFYCNPNALLNVSGGCNYTVKDNCSFKCELEDFRDCLANTSTIVNDSCAYGYCDAHKVEGDGDENWITECKLSAPVNCIDSESDASKEAKELNMANDRVCYTPICGVNGKCTTTKIPLPEGMVADNCTEPRCVPVEGTGSWTWQMVTTKVAQSCQTDDCYDRECVPDQGCVATEKCRVKSNECFSYTCGIENNQPKCLETNLTETFLDLECMKEVCENGKRVVVYKPLDEACPHDNKCDKTSCVNGSCVFTPTNHTGNDICLNYQCNPKTGVWSTTPKCDDGLACTIDSCKNYGTFYECHFVKIDCSNISMEGYDCFRPSCKEGGNSTSYKCVRKLLPNAYIDVCGNCIKDDPEADSEASQGIFTACTLAPPEPFYVETLAAATIALIVVGAVIAGSAVTTSTVLGTKTLISRARDANNQSAHNNPLFEGADNEMTNPGFDRENSKSHF